MRSAASWRDLRRRRPIPELALNWATRQIIELFPLSPAVELECPAACRAALLAERGKRRRGREWREMQCLVGATEVQLKSWRGPCCLAIKASYLSFE